MHKPLQGIRVLDLTQAWSGPLSSMMLGDIGAEIIKVEPVEIGDHVRNWTNSKTKGQSPHFLAANRNKKSITIDLKSEKGKELFLQLAEQSDVILENFRPGTVTKLGIDYEVVRKRNNSIIFCSLSGFGQTGPYRDVAAYDLIIQGEGGAMSVTGEPGGKPLKPGVPQADYLGGIVTAFTILAAMMSRQQTGQGAYLDVAMLDAQISLIGYQLVKHMLTGDVDGPMGTAHPLLAPYQSFRTKDIDINLGVGNEKAWHKFCHTLECPDWLTDPRFATNEQRVKNRQALESLIEEKLSSHEARYWLALFKKNGVPAGAVNTLDRLVTHEQVMHRNMLPTIHHPEVGDIPIPGIPWKLPGIDEDEILPPPLLGQHNQEILKNVLHYTEQQICELMEMGVISRKADD